ncbi:MAG: hypothetical protein K0S36_2300 [Nitrosospira multiformis]|nr:hypothetical protein [Nitrosospira multiformis]
MLSKESGDEDESVILNKSGKGYSLQKHKELRVENHLIFG